VIRSRCSGERSRHPDEAAAVVERDERGPPGRRNVRVNVTPSNDSMPGIARAARNSSVAPRSHRRAVRQPQSSTPGATGPKVRRVARSPVGVVANTAWIVSLNCRTLANPAANATSAAGNDVVSSRTRAVCARWARARASGPAPTSATSARWIWRSE